jgi:integrase
MPLRLQAPRRSWSPNYSIRGTYLGVKVYKSCGTDRRSVAQAELKRLEEQIERREYPAREAAPSREQPNFLDAALAYMEAGKRSRYVGRLIKHFGETLLCEIDQAAIDAAAVALHPNVTPGARNAAVYTPVSAILHHAGVEIKIKRPKGAKGRVVTDWLTPEDASAIISAAESFDPELGLLLRFLLYTGVRLGEALKLTWDDVRLEEAAVWTRRQERADVRCPTPRRSARGAHKEVTAPIRRRVFRFHQGGWLKHLLVRAKLKALGLPCPDRRPKGWRAPPYKWKWVNFHSYRHTWATWMRRYAGADVEGLVATGNWRDRRSAARYAHAVARDEWKRVERLPAIGPRAKSVQSSA